MRKKRGLDPSAKVPDYRAPGCEFFKPNPLQEPLGEAAERWGFSLDEETLSKEVTYSYDGQIYSCPFGEVPVEAASSAVSTGRALDVARTLKVLARYGEVAAPEGESLFSWALALLSMDHASGKDALLVLMEDYTQSDSQEVRQRALLAADKIREVAKELVASKTRNLLDWEGPGRTYMAVSTVNSSLGAAEMLRSVADFFVVTRHGNVVCSVPDRVLKKLNLHPWRLRSQGGPVLLPGLPSSSMVVAAETYPSPKVDDIAAFEELFRTFLRDGQSVRDAYLNACLI